MSATVRSTLIATCGAPTSFEVPWAGAVRDSASLEFGPPLAIVCDMEFRVVAEPVQGDAHRLLVVDVLVSARGLRVSGAVEPWWMGPPTDVRVRIGMDYVTVVAVECDESGFFAVQAEGVVFPGDLVSVGIGDGWTVIELDS